MSNTKLPLWPGIATSCAFIGLCTFAGTKSGLEPAWFYVYMTPIMIVVSFRLLLFFGNVPRLTPDGRLLVHLGALLLVVLVGFFRGIDLEQIDASESSLTTVIVFAVQIFFAWAACFLVGMYFDVNRRRVLAGALYWSALVMMFAQILLLIVGVQHKDAIEFLQTANYSTTLMAFGVEALRWQVPLATGVNGGTVYFTFAALAAISLRGYHSRFLMIIAISVAAAGLALIDSRAAIVAIPFVLFMCRIFAKRPRLLALVAVLLPAGPLIAVAFIDYMPDVIVEIAGARASVYGLFAGRETIWLSVWQYHLGNASAIHLLFGEGFYGQVGGGLIPLYRHLFYGFGQSTLELATLHNVYVQVFVDYGLIGLFLFIAIVYRVVFILASNTKSEVSGERVWGFLLRFLLALLMESGTEAVLTPYVKEGFSFFLGVISLTACFARGESANKAASVPDGPENRFPSLNDLVRGNPALPRP